MVRAEDAPNRLKLIEVIRKTQEQAYIRLLLDYHCLQLLWSWMIELEDVDLKAEIIRLLEFLNIPNKTMLKDSKVLDVVERWSKQKDSEHDLKKPVVNGDILTNGDVEMEVDQVNKKVDCKEESKLTSDDLKRSENKEDEKPILPESETQKDNHATKPIEPSPTTTLKGLNIVKKYSKPAQEEQQKSKPNIAMMAARLLNLWKDLKEVYRIPRLERQKRHEDEREADRKAKEMENDSKLNNNTILPSLRKNIKRPFDQINRPFSYNYDSYKQRYPFTNHNNYQNATNEHTSNLMTSANKVSKEEHRAFYNVELMRKDYEEAMRQYKKQMEQINVVMQQQINMSNSGIPIAPTAPIILPAPPAPPNITLQNIQNLASSINNNSSSTINVNNINNINNLLNQPTTPSPSTNTFHYNKLYNDEFNSNSLTNTPIYNNSNLNNVNETSSTKYHPQKFYSQENDYLSQSAFTHQSHPQQQHPKELITYNHLLQPQQSLQQQQDKLPAQQMDCQQPQTEFDESLSPEKSWNTLFAELTGGLKSSLIELTNASHVFNEQTSDDDQPDHLVKYNYSDEISDQERREIDNLFITPGTYFVNENKTYFIPCNFVNKNGYEYDQNDLVIESKGEFVIPSKIEANKTDLPENWSSAKDKNGYYYYINNLTNQIQWNVPLDKENLNSKNKSISEQNGSNLDLATLNEILKLSSDSKNGKSNESQAQCLKNDSISNDLDEQLNNSLSMELENKIVKFPYQQPSKPMSERRLKEKFKSDLSEHIKNVLNPYRKHDCKVGRILCNDDFKYLAKKVSLSSFTKIF